MRFTRKHMVARAVVLLIAVGGYAAYNASYALGYFVGSN